MQDVVGSQRAIRGRAGRVMLAGLLAGLGACTCSQDGPSTVEASQGAVGSSTAEATEGAVSFELVAQAPWSRTALPEPIVASGSLVRAPAPVRIAPALTVGADGALWLKSATFHGAATVVRAGGAAAFPLAAADVDLVVALAPLGDGVVVLGRKGARNVLARLDAQRERRWRHEGPIDRTAADPADLRGQGAGLFADAGGLHLWMTAGAGARAEHLWARVDPASGEVGPGERVVVGRTTLQARWGKRAHWEANGADRTWVVRDLADGSTSRVTAPVALREAIALEPVLLPDGGAVGHDATGALHWMTGDGQHRASLPLAGFVRAGGELVVGLAGAAGQLTVERWRDGHRTGRVSIGSLEGRPVLFAVQGERVWIEQGEDARRLSVFDAAGTLIEEHPALDPTERLRLATSTGVRTPVVTEGGDVLLGGADSRGAFVVRIRPQ